MTTINFITELFCHVDDVRWVMKDLICLFPGIPCRTSLFRLFKVHMNRTDHFPAEPTIPGVADTYGIELIHPIREGRSPTQIGRKGKSDHRWIVGGKLCLVINQFGLVTGWGCDTANVYDATFHPLIGQFDEKMIVLTDAAFHSKLGDPSDMKICERGKWNQRMVIETVLPMLTTISHFKKVGHRVWDYFKARLAYTMAIFNILVQWHGFKPDKNGFIELSIA